LIEDEVTILEDEAIIAAHIQMLLKESGFSFFRIYSTAESFIRDYNITVKPDILIVDIKLSGTLSGTDAVRVLNPPYPGIIFLSGKIDKIALSKEDFPFSYDLLKKPFSEEELIRLCKIHSRSFSRSLHCT